MINSLKSRKITKKTTMATSIYYRNPYYSTIHPTNHTWISTNNTTPVPSPHSTGHRHSSGSPHHSTGLLCRHSCGGHLLHRRSPMWLLQNPRAPILTAPHYRLNIPQNTTAPQRPISWTRHTRKWNNWARPHFPAIAVLCGKNFWVTLLVNYFFPQNKYKS